MVACPLPLSLLVTAEGITQRQLFEEPLSSGCCRAWRASFWGQGKAGSACMRACAAATSASPWSPAQARMPSSCTCL